MKKLYTLVIVVAIGAFVLELVNINLSGRLASNSVSVTKLQQSIARLDEQNQILQTQVLTLTSYENIASVAAGLGFVPATNYISLQNSVKLSYSR